MALGIDDRDFWRLSMWAYQSAFEAYELKNGVKNNPEPAVSHDELDELYQRVAAKRGVDSIL